MNEIKDFIEKVINPPGILKKNRKALFDTIRDIYNLVRTDALTAFNAHFPYLADDKKLKEHGDALLIPRLIHDTDKEYRERVATASFFLMKAGERQYIMGQLEERFPERYKIIEEFLNIHLKITGLTDDERAWALELLDSLLNPNIYTELSEWFHFLEKERMRETLTTKAKFTTSDSIDDGRAKLNGMVKLDGVTISDPVSYKPILDGDHILDGTLSLSGSAKNIPLSEFPVITKNHLDGKFDLQGFKNLSGKEIISGGDYFIHTPLKLGQWFADNFSMRLALTAADTYVAKTSLSGAVKLGGAQTLDGTGNIGGAPQFKVKYTIADTENASEKLTVRVKPKVNDTFNTVRTSLEGAKKLDGTYRMGRGVLDKNTMKAAVSIADAYKARLSLIGGFKLDGSEKQNGFGRPHDSVSVRIKYYWKLDGETAVDGSVKLNAGILLAA